MSGQSNKRALSSVSDLDSTNSGMENSILEENQSPLSKKERRKQKKNALSKKQRTIDEYVEHSVVEDSEEPKSMSSKLDEINKKLSKMLTKDDKSFIKNIIKTTIEEMKEQILSSVTRRIEILENEIHEKSLETEKLKREVTAKDSKIEQLTNKNTDLSIQLEKESSLRERDVNNLEQYGRRNNVRITGLPNDVERQDSDSVTREVVHSINEKTGLNIEVGDVDIAHRLGKWAPGKNRPVIVKFVRRQTKVNVMKKSKELRKSKLFINEDLTFLNRQVLSSLRLKDPDNVEKCWSMDGKIYCLYRDHNRPVEIQYKDYNAWLNKPWPKRS